MEPTGVDNDAKCHLKGRRRRCLHLSGVKAPPQPQAEKCHPSLTRVVHTQTYGMFGSLETGDCHELHRISQSHLAAAEGAVWRAVLRSFVRSVIHSLCPPKSTGGHRLAQQQTVITYSPLVRSLEGSLHSYLHRGGGGYRATITTDLQSTYSIQGLAEAQPSGLVPTRKASNA